MSVAIPNVFHEFSTEEEQDYGLPKHPNRTIMLGDVKSKRFMVVSNDAPIIKALAQHKWTWEIDENRGDWKAKNADPASIWQYAEDLIVYTLVKNKTDTKGRLLVSTPEMYFEVVHVVQGNRKPFDLRSHKLSVRLRKIGKSTLEKNKIRNKELMHGDTPEERRAKASKNKFKLKPEDDDDEGVLNDWTMPLADSPLSAFGDETTIDAWIRRASIARERREAAEAAAAAAPAQPSTN